MRNTDHSRLLYTVYVCGTSAVCWCTTLAGERYGLCTEALRGGGSAQGDGSSTEQLQSFQEDFGTDRLHISYSVVGT